MDYDQVSPTWFQTVDTADIRASIVSSFASSSSDDGDSESDVDRWIVRLTPEATRAAGSVTKVSELMGQGNVPLRVVRGLGLPGQLLVEATAGDRIAVEDAFQTNPNVATFERDEIIDAQLIANDPLFTALTGLNNIGQSGGTTDADIDAPEAWELTTGSSDVVIAVIDTGVDYTHPDLDDNIWTNPGEIPGNEIDDDRNGFTDDVHGYDFHNNDGDPMDDNRHGTHVAGTIGAEGNNGIGVAGVNWTTSVMALKFLDQNNRGQTSDAIRAINYATMMRTTYDVNVRVTNNSWGRTGGYSSNLFAAIEASRDADILFVAASGNGDILGRGQNNDWQPFYPASYNLENIISVAASDQDDSLARFSNYGPVSVDLAAPGIGVFSTERLGTYASRNGTSMAAPHVTGVAALVWSQTPDATMTEVRNAILESVDEVSSLKHRVASKGRLNAHRALSEDTVRPRATLVTAPDISEPGGTSQPITIHYSDNVAIDASSLGDDDIVVTRRYGSGETFSVVFDQLDQSIDGPSRLASYRWSAPNGFWEPSDTGLYDILLQPGAVHDVAGNAAKAIAIGSFTIEIAVEGTYRVNSFIDSVDADIGDGFPVDASGNISLRSAIQEANLPGNRIAIFLSAGTYPLELGTAGEDAAAGGDLDITGEMTIIGLGAGQTIIDAGSLDRVFDIRPGGVLTLSGVTVTGGSVSGAVDGGGIRNLSELHLSETLLTENTTEQNGGGIYSEGTLDVVASTISNNSADDGGGIFNAGTATITGSTVSGNSVFSQGGGVFNSNTAIATITSSTISNNSADGKGDIAPQDSDVSGHVFVVESKYERIFRYDVEGIRTGLFRDSGGEYFIAPAYLTMGPDGNLYVGELYQSGNYVVVLDPEMFSPIRKIFMNNTSSGGWPRDVAFDSAGRMLVLKIDTGAIDVYENDVPVQAGLVTGLSPATMTYYDGHIYVGQTGGIGYSVFDAATGDEIPGSPFGGGVLSGDTVHAIAVGPDIGGGPDGAKDGVLDLYVTNSSGGSGPVAVFSGADNSIITTNLTGDLSKPRGLTTLPNGDLIIVATGSGFVYRWDGTQLTNFSGLTYRLDYLTDVLYSGGPFQGYARAGGGIFNASGSSIAVGNTLIAGNFAGDRAPDVAGGFNSTGHNLVGSLGIAAGFDQSGDQVVADAGDYLGPLQDNGGPTWTHRLLLGSTAIDAGDSGVTGTDQRGIPRMQDGNGDGTAADDIGAVERFFAEIQGTRFHDLNGDGIRDLDEPGLPNMTVFLDLNDNGQRDVDEPTTLTRADDPTTIDLDEAGVFLFPGLEPGTYTVNEESLVGWSTTQPLIYSGNAAVDLGPVGLPQSVRAADFDGDGFIDLAIVNDAIPRAVSFLHNEGNGTFATPVNSVFGHLASDIGLADLDGDGDIDIVVTDSNLFTGGVSILLNRGDGSFAVQLKMEFGQSIRGVALGDYDGDGDIDMALANDGGQSIVVMRNTGTGAFTDAMAYLTAKPYRISTADMNRDGILDLVVSGFNSTTVSILDGSGDGTFGPARVVDAGQRFAEPVAVDVDADNDLDLVGINPDNSTVLIMLNRGNATFTDAMSNPVGFIPEMISVGDIDGDGDNDLVVPNSASDNVSVLRNYGDGTFAAAIQVPLAGGPSSTAIGDFNGDDAIDMAVVLGNSHQVVVVPNSQGVHSATLTTGGALLGADFGDQPLPGKIEGQQFHDLDRDGVKDPGEPGIAGWTIFLDLNEDGVLDEGEPSSVTDDAGRYSFEHLASLTTYFVTQSANDDWEQTFPAATDFGRWSIELAPAANVADADFGNFFLDPGGQSLDGTLVGWKFVDFNGNGSFDANEPGIPGQTVFLDFNDNGVLDGEDISTETTGDDPQTADIDETGRYEFANLGPGTYAVRTLLAGDSTQTSPLGNVMTTTHFDVADAPQSVVLADIDGQNGDDLVVANGNVVSILTNNADGTFADETVIGLGDSAYGAVAVATGDFDGVNGIDLAVANYFSSNISVLLRNADGTYAAPTTIMTGVFPRSIVAGDLNHDSYPDLVVTNEWNGNLSIFWNDGSGGFTPDPVQPTVGASPFSLVLGQFNDDNADGVIDHRDDTDLAVANFDSDDVSILLNDGNARFVARHVRLGTAPSSVFAGDFNGDGNLDLAVSNFLSDNVSVLLNDGEGLFAVTQSAPAGTGPFAVSSIDLDHDGDLDLIVANGTTEHLAVLRNNGLGVFALPENFGVGNLSSSLSFSVASGDLNGDGIPDLAVANGEARNLSVLLNTPVSGAHRLSLLGVETVSGLDFGIQPSNSAPLANAGGPYALDELSDLTLDASASVDPDALNGDMIVEYAWDLDNNGAFDNAVGSQPIIGWATLVGLNLTFPADPSTGSPTNPITLRVTDSFGLTNIAQSELVIYRNRPVPLISADPIISAPQQEVHFDAAQSYHGGPGRSIVSYEWDFDYDGLVFDVDGSGISMTHTFAAFGQYMVALRVTDDSIPAKTELTTQQFNVSVGNRPPVADAGGPYVINETGDLTLDGTGSSDPDSDRGDSIVSYQWDLDGDGLFDDAEGANAIINWTTLGNLRLVHPANPLTGMPNNTIGLRVIDRFGEATTSLSEVAIYRNQPIASFVVDPNPVARGQAIRFDATESTHGHPAHSIVQYEWDFDYDGVSFDVDATGITTDNAYLEIGQYSVALRVTDDNAVPQVATFADSVDVLTALLVSVDLLSTQDTTPALSGTVEHPLATIEVTVAGKVYDAVNHGDGNWTLPDNTINPPLSTGVYDVRVTAFGPNDEIGNDATLDELTVDATFAVTQFKPTPSGFSIQLNEDIDSSVLNLFDTESNVLGPADVTLTGDASGPIRGSIVIDENLVTYVASDGLLPNDHYTVRLRSAVDGFKRSDNAALLDGDADGTTGDDYVNDFLVNVTGQRVVSLPHFARGPRQTINIPVQHVGLPIHLDDGSGVLAVDLTLKWDPQLLEVTSVDEGADLPGGWTVLANLSTPGQAIVSMAGTGVLPSGSLELLRLTAEVPATAPYGEAQVIRIEELLINEGLIPSVSVDAIHKVAFLGDVSGNADYLGLDASLLQRVVVGLDDGFSSYSKVDPLILGDTSGNGGLSSFDVSLIAQKTVFLDVPQVPDLPLPRPTVPPTGPDPTLTIAVDHVATPGNVLTLPVAIDNAVGLQSALVTINYDTNVFDLDNNDISKGSILRDLSGNESWLLTANVRDASGTITVLVSSAVPLVHDVGELIEIAVHVRGDAASGATTVDLDESGTHLNGGALLLTAHDGSVTIVSANPGDFNADGDVDGDDLNLVRSNWGNAGSNAPNGWINDYPDAMIDQNELDRVLLNWGNIGIVPASTAVSNSLVSITSEQPNLQDWWNSTRNNRPGPLRPIARDVVMRELSMEDDIPTLPETLVAAVAETRQTQPAGHTLAGPHRKDAMHDRQQERVLDLSLAHYLHGDV